ncbi:hypothetical protein GOC00_10700 [Sinorhizobium meliloti]|uniref:hypothetical protein n=1 Tax=Rhizobium meliloti TaxID=382 RepID=UPI00299EE8D1|nr:hypothetical protein [Sinorhizobium meliloti]MDX0000097.1 hypothetical protein [Sinorhizobium meliloti]MDX0075700.1 hypothetical protein [Sinorhizobium meliloti]MDX0210938.1 hypothetical protein [Sinorhizobium meliloti]
MDLPELLEELSHLTAPSRRVDAKLALVAGWQRKATRTKGDVNVIWLFPGEEVNRLPEFTNSIDAALELVGILAPSQVGGFSWGSSGKAQLNDGEIAEGVNPAVALCLAAVKYKAKNA